jgi:hypothetical protein
VIAWDPPTRVEFTWNPSRRADDRQTVNVEFRVEADGTQVTVTHRGWQLYGVAVSASRTTPVPAGAPSARCLLASFAVFVAEEMLVGV